MSFSDNLIDNLSLKLNSIIGKYKSLDDFSPFTLEIFENCKNIISTYEEKFKEQFNYVDSKEKTYLEKIEKLIENFNNEKIKLEKDSKEKIKNLNVTTESSIKKLDDDIRIKTEELNNKILKYEEELNEFISTNDENIKMFKAERNDKINSYEFQIRNASISYNDNIEIYNDELSEKIDKENKKHEKEMAEYEDSISKIKDRYNEKILNANLELSEFSSNFSMVQAKQRDEKKDQAIELNNKIRVLYDDNNRLLLEEKTNYEKDKTVNKIEKDRAHQDYILMSKQISNEFFLSMKKLNEKSNISKAQYNKSVVLTKKKYQSKFFNINKIYENDIRAIIDEDNKTLYKEKAKAASSQFYKSSKANKKSLDEEMHSLNTNYRKIQTHDNYEKKQADIYRKYNLEAIDEKETRDTKYFQEVNNLDENEYSFKTKMLNYNYNEKANAIRYEANLKGIDTDCAFEKENAIYQKNIQHLMNNVKKTKNELNAVKELNEKVKLIEKKRHETNINFLTVYYLLEIEKIRVLDDYNHKAYNLNLLNSNTIYSFSKENIEIQNKRKIDIKDVTINIDKAQYAQDLYDISSQKNNLIEKNNYNINLEKNNYSYKSTLNLHSFFKDRFNLELKILYDILSSYTIITRQALALFISIIKECSTSSVTDINFNFFKGFIIEINSEIMNFFISLNSTFLTSVNVYVEDRSKFESDYKFNSLFEEIHGDYKSKVNSVLDQMAEIEDKIRKNDFIINECQKSISTIKSQIYYINEQSSKSKRKENKKKITDLENEIVRLNVKIVNTKNNSIPLNEKMTELNQLLQSLNSSYDKQTSKLDDIESKSTEAYYELKKRFNQIVSSIKDDTSSFKQAITCENYISKFDEKRIELTEYGDKFIHQLFNVLNDFSQNVNLSYENEYNMILENNNSEINILNLEHDKIIKAYSKELKKERETNYKNIAKARVEKRAIEINYQKNIRAFNKDYDKSLRRILNDQNNNMQKFYDDYYAVESNQKDIVDNYYLTIKALDDESAELKAKIVHDVEVANSKLDNELRKFIQSKDVLIKNIPNEIKDKKINLKNENNKLNNDIKLQRNLAKGEYIKQKNESNSLLYEINITYKQRLLMVKKNKKHEEKKAYRRHNYELKRGVEKKFTTL